MCPETLSSSSHSCTEVRVSLQFLCTLAQSHQGGISPRTSHSAHVESLHPSQCVCTVKVEQAKKTKNLTNYLVFVHMDSLLYSYFLLIYPQTFFTEL